MTKTINVQRCQEHQKFDDPNVNTCLDCKNKKISHLEKQIGLWKDAWYHQRDATGFMAWTIPSPFYLSHQDQQLFLKLADLLKNNVKENQNE